MSSDINVQTFSGKVNITSNLLVGTSHLFVDTINNRVGLVTSNPDAGLHVNSNAYVHTDFRVGSGIVMNDTNGRITAGSFVGDGSAMTGINSDSGSWVNGTNSNVHLATSTDNVGIGTTSPGATLDIRGSTNDPSTPTVHIGDNVADQGDYGMVNLVRDATNGGTKAHLAFIRNGNTIFGQGYYNNTNTFGFWSSFGSIANLPAMSITTTGNVGIGVADPATTGLHVANSYNPSGGNTTHFDPQIYISGDTGTNGTQVSAIGFNGNSASVGHRRMVAGSMYYKGTTGNYGMDGYLGLAVADTSTGGADPYGLTEGELESHTRLAITNAGNVGIGTTGPGRPLDVHFTGDTGIRAKNTGSTHASVYIDSASGYSYLRFQSSGAEKFWLQSTPTGDLAFRPSGSGHVMDIKNNGNVGIGVTNPGEKLHVDGIIKAQAVNCSGGGPVITCTASNPGDMISKRYGSADRYGMGQYGSGVTRLFTSTAYSPAKIALSGATDDVTGSAAAFTDYLTVVASSGNVGIGTTSPGYKLDVAGNLRVTTGILDTSWCSGSWLQTCTQSPTVTVYSNNGGGPMSTPGHGGVGMGGNRGRFTAKKAGNYLISCCAVHMGRGGADASGTNLLVVFDAVGTNWNPNNVINTYDEIIDLRVAPTAEEAYTFACQVYMNVGHYFSFRVHSSGYIDNNAKLLCSAALVR